MARPDDRDALIEQVVKEASKTPAGVPLDVQMRQRDDGLILPAPLVGTRYPIDLIQVYLTADDLLDNPPRVDWLLDQLEKLSIDDVLPFTTYWIARTAGPETNKATDLAFADMYFAEPARTHVKAQVRNERRLVLPQALLVMTKLALFRCGSQTREANAVRALPLLMLVTASSLGRNDDSPDALVSEIIANHHFNNQSATPTRLALYEARWHEPAVADDLGPLANVYDSITGINLSALELITIAAWSSAAMSGQAYIRDDYLDNIPMRRDAVKAVFDHLSASPEKFRELIRENEISSPWNSVPWMFSPFEQFPLLRVDGGWFVINPEFLLNRLTGWPLFLDVEQTLLGTGDKKESARQGNRFRSATERYVRGILSETYDQLPGRVYGEETLQELLGNKGKVADAAIDYGHSWVVMEISTRRLMRDSVHGGASTRLEDEIDKLCEKAKQIDATIKRIRSQKFRELRGENRKPSFYPVIMLTEGFPVNPITLSRLREVLRMKSILVGRDTAPIELMDMVDLEIVEAVAEGGGPSLVEILRSKGSGTMQLASVRDHIREVLRMNPNIPRRVRLLYGKFFTRIASRFPASEAEAFQGYIDLESRNDGFGPQNGTYAKT